MKIVTFGNCQVGQLKKLLSELLPSSKFSIAYLSNNQRTGKLKSHQEILAAIGDCDILAYQPLGISHGALCEENIRQNTKKGCLLISFPYVFNSGAYSLCHAPMVSKHYYGFIYGEEVIIDLFKAGKSKDEIIYDYKRGAINFNLIKRFHKCLSELEKRELTTKIKISKFIKDNYQKKLFITHNHPSNIVFYEFIRQIITFASLPIDPAKIDKLTTPDLHETNCPITPHDIKINGYQFDVHHDWFVKGSALIGLIIDNYVKQYSCEQAT